MQIHELNRKRRTDEGVLSTLGAVGKSAATALGQSIAPSKSQNSPAKSAGILDPKQKLAAVKREPAMIKLATQYADEWLKSQPQTQPQAQPQAPAPAQPETPEQKRIRLQKAAQQNIDKTAVPGASPAVPQTPAAIRQAKQAQATQQARAQMAAVKEDTTVATPGTYSKKTGAAKLGGKTMTAFADLPPHIQQQIQAKQQPAAPAPAAQTFSAGNVIKMPGMEKYTQPSPAATTAPPQPTPPATDPYMNDFLEFANKKIAIRDPSTYQMIGLAAVEQADLKAELDAAKQAVKAAEGDPAQTKTAVRDYILTALAGAQLIASKNKVAAATPRVPAYKDQTAQGKTTQPQASISPAADQVTALLNSSGIDRKTLSSVGYKLQNLSGNTNLTSTGDSNVDQLLRSLGYKVS